MPAASSFEHFESELNRLVEKFGRNLTELKSTGYDEAKLRLEYLDPLFKALGWDMENRAGIIQQKRELLELPARGVVEATRMSLCRLANSFALRVSRR